MLHKLLSQVGQLPPVSSSAALEYDEKKALLINQVNRSLKDSPHLADLIGQSSLQVLYENHANHALVMSTVLQLGLYEMLFKVVLWVYRSYQARGFSHNYFPITLQFWIEAIKDNLKEEHAREITFIYSWLLQQHPHILEIAGDLAQVLPEIDPRLERIRVLFMQSLLEGDSHGALRLALSSVNNKEDLVEFYIEVIQPVMYEIGLGWEKGDVSVAQEHLASAIISRAMSVLYQNYVISAELRNKSAVVTSAPNEFHEIGAHMVADFLELDGWDVHYLGANTPVQDLLELLLERKPFLLAISVTMPFNLKEINNIVQAVRNNPVLNKIKIMAGGNAFNLEQQLWEKLKADGWAADARQAVELARTWYEEAGYQDVE